MTRRAFNWVCIGVAFTVVLIIAVGLPARASTGTLLLGPDELPYTYDEMMAVVLFKHFKQISAERYIWFRSNGTSSKPAIKFTIDYTSSQGDVRFITFSGPPPSVCEGLAAIFPDDLALEDTEADRWESFKYDFLNPQMLTVQLVVFDLGKDEVVLLGLLPGAARDAFALANHADPIESAPVIYAIELPRSPLLAEFAQYKGAELFSRERRLYLPSSTESERPIEITRWATTPYYSFQAYSIGREDVERFLDALRRYVGKDDAGSLLRSFGTVWSTSFSPGMLREVYPTSSTTVSRWSLGSNESSERVQRVEPSEMLGELADAASVFVSVYSLRDNRVFVLIVPTPHPGE